MGYHVIEIPYWEWNDLKTDKEKRSYLRRVIY